MGSFAVIVMFFKGWVDFVGGLGFCMGWRRADLTTFMFVVPLLMLCHFTFCNSFIFILRSQASDRYSNG